MKKKWAIPIGYSLVTLIATYAVGQILLHQFPDGKAAGASVLFILMNLTPMMTACIFSLATKECVNVWDFFKKAFLQKENAVACLLALAIPVIYYGFPAILHHVHFTHERIGALFAYLPWALLQGGLEEVGWRWYLQKHLPMKSFFLRMLIISVVWFAWHMPVYALPWVTAASSDYAVCYLMILGNTFTLGVLGEKTNGAVPCIVSHMLIDACAVVMLVQSNLACVAASAAFGIALSLLANQYIQAKPDQ